MHLGAGAVHRSTHSLRARQASHEQTLTCTVSRIRGTNLRVSRGPCSGCHWLLSTNPRAELQTDHKEVMKQIEKAMMAYHEELRKSKPAPGPKASPLHSSWCSLLTVWCAQMSASSMSLTPGPASAGAPAAAKKVPVALRRAFSSSSRTCSLAGGDEIRERWCAHDSRSTSRA